MRLSLSRNPLTYGKLQPFVRAAYRLAPPKPDHGAILNIGAGTCGRPEVFDIDYTFYEGIDLVWDVTRRLPIEDNTVAGIFTEHCLEHIPFDAVQSILGDFHRILIPGSAIRISVPDGEIYARQYASGGGLPYAEEELSRDPRWTPMQSVNRIFRDYGHQFIYDYHTMKLCLERAGFADVKKERFGSGRDPRLLLDQEHRECESLYVEATKP